MKIEPLTVAANFSLTAAASNVSNAQQVLVQNTDGQGKYVHIEKGTSGVRYASFYIAAKDSIIARKNADDEIFCSNDAAGTAGNVNVLFTKVGFYG